MRLMPDKVWKTLSGTRSNRRIRKRVQRWARLGSEIFCCHPDYLFTLWQTIRDNPLTMEEVVSFACHLSELSQAGISAFEAGKEMRERLDKGIGVSERMKEG